MSSPTMKLPDIEQLSPFVTRILGQNPGKFTLQGTNTYLVGRTSPYILIDTGESEKPEYISLLESHLSASSKSKCLISDIILTHKHHDHVGGLSDVLSLLSKKGSPTPRVHTHPQTPLSSIPDLSVHHLTDGANLTTQDRSSRLEILHAPGHTPDSICIVLHAENPLALLTADSVLGEGTSVFEDLATYMSSLRRLVDLSVWPIPIYPGHGPVVPAESAKSYIEMYITHREERERQIVGVMRDKGGRASVRDLVEVLYADYPRTIWPAAAQGVWLHLKKLEVEGRVRRIGESGEDKPDGDAWMDIVWELVGTD